MINGIGIDIVEVQRIEKILSQENLLKKIFTEKELKLFTKNKIKAQHLAARFAAKEALIKAVSKRLTLNEIEILNKKNGQPYFNFSNKYKKYFVDKKILLSLSHIPRYAVAMVVVTKVT